jgi:hypothetical protein
VNLIGEKNLEYEVEPNFDEVCRLLSLLGISVNIRFVHEITVTDLSRLSLADLNVLREPSLTGVGKTLLDLFGTPYIDSFPVGLRGTLEFLRDAGQAAGIDSDHAISREDEYQRSMIADFSDLAGTGVYCRVPGNFLKNPVLEEVICRTGLRHDKNGVVIPAPVPQPIGTCGIRRMLHRWRRAIT